MNLNRQAVANDVSVIPQNMRIPTGHPQLRKA
jgi:hypothetical protein